MGDRSPIQWTDASWNPVRGCSRTSPGCGGPNHEGGCYAERIAARFSDPGQPFHGFAERTKHGGRWTGKLALVPELLNLPLRWRKPRRIFVNSMSDLFHESLPDEAIDQVFAVMALAPQHTFQVLTKRAERMRRYFADPLRAALIGHQTADLNGAGWPSLTPLPLPNVWLGVSVEDQQRADDRIPALLETPAAVRFLSCEPLLSSVDLAGHLVGHEVHGIDLSREVGSKVGACIGWTPPVDWVICGAESGPRARPFDEAWARQLRNQCQAAGVPFFLKQFADARGRKISTPELDGRRWTELPA